MPVHPTYPGVYIEEVPGGVHTIAGVATSITAFIGRALRGPINQAITINSFADFERTFGGLWRENALGYAVRDFFVNGGSQAMIVRLYHSSIARRTAASEVAKAAKTNGPTPQSVAGMARIKANEYAHKSKEEKEAADAVARATEEAAKKQGATVDTVKTAASEAASKYTTAGATQNAAKATAQIAEKEATRQASTPQSVVGMARIKANEYAHKSKEEKEAADAVARATEEAAKKQGATVDTVKKAASEAAEKINIPDKSSLTVASLPLVAAYEGSWGGNLRGYVDFDVSGEAAAHLGLAGSDPCFNLTVQEEGASGRIERHRNLSLKASPRCIDKVLEVESALVRWGTLTKPEDYTVSLKSLQDALHVAQQDLVKSPDDQTKKLALEVAEQALIDQVTVAEKKFDDANRHYMDVQAGKEPDQSKIEAARKVMEQAQSALSSVLAKAQASDGEALQQNDFTSSEKESNKEGLYALEQADLFNILCIPPYTVTGDVETSVIAQAAAYCEQRRAILLVDPPSTWISKEVARSQFLSTSPDHVGTRSKNAALFFPRIKVADPLQENRLVSCVPSGAVAGVLARTDATRGVWKAPAGLEASLVGVSQLCVPLTDVENGELNPLGINCLRAFPAAGPVIWGARTLQGADRLASEWKYLPVRRTALFIEESLYRGTQWVIFEPNDEPLWAQIRLNVGAFLHNLFRKGAFQGKNPQEAYFVKCDKETTTQNDIDQGIVNVLVGFAPLKPAEFLLIKVQQIAGQIQA